MFVVFAIDMKYVNEEVMIDTFDTLEEAFNCVWELEQFYDYYFDMYSNYEFVVRDYIKERK